MPTPEEAATLRKVADSIPMVAYSLCIVELAERASYYGVQTVFSNFMQFPLPDGGNGAGSPARGTEDTAGALGKGEQFAVAIGLLFSFLAYVVPIFGAYGADVYTGRFRMILYGVLVCGIAHIIVICGAIPSVLQAGKGIAPFMISLILLAIGAGKYWRALSTTICADNSYRNVQALCCSHRHRSVPTSTRLYKGSQERRESCCRPRSHYSTNHASLLRMYQHRCLFRHRHHLFRKIHWLLAGIPSSWNRLFPPTFTTALPEQASCQGQA